MFVKGDRVTHKLLGLGTVADVRHTPKITQIVVKFDNEKFGSRKLSPTMLQKVEEKK